MVEVHAMTGLDFNVVWGQEDRIFWMLGAFCFPLLMVFGFWRRYILLNRLGKFEVLKKMLPQRSIKRELFSLALMSLSFILLCIASMQPQWGEQTRLVETRTLDILLLQDVSQSMLAQDVKPSRLLRSQHEISYFIDHLEGDRIGLMAFGASTRLLCPMTQDYNALKMFLKELDPTMVLQGTDVALAIQKGLSRFNEESIQSKLVVLLSDGEEHDPQAIEIAKEAARRGIKIYTVGIGSLSGVKIPDPRRPGKWKKDGKGQEIKTRLNEKVLVEIAEITGAEYFHASQGGFQLTRILDAIREMERDSLGESEVVEYEQKYLLFALIAFVLSLLEWILPKNFVRLKLPKKWKSLSLLFSVLILMACSNETVTEGGKMQKCSNARVKCLDKAWSHLVQLDSAKTPLDTLFWVIESQANSLGAISGEDRGPKLFALANELKWPVLQKIDSLNLLAEKLPELDERLSQLESDVIHEWYGREREFSLLIQTEVNSNSKALRLGDLYKRLQDLRDIETGILPDRKMSWNHRLIEWGRQ